MNSEKVVLITGSGRGIGAATAKLFAEHGYSICINYKSNPEPAAQTEAFIRKLGAKCISVQADVSLEKDVQKLFTTIEAELGSLTVLVNNAGILRPQCRLDEMTADRINTVLVNNITGYFLCSREAVRKMSTKHGGDGGAIVNVSSVAARTGSPNEYIDYAASKGAIDTLTKGLSVEVAAEGIRVNCVRPGMIYTEMHADGGEANRVERLKSKIPMQRGGQVNEIAAAIFWLASENSSYSTGSILDLAGGV